MSRANWFFGVLVTLACGACTPSEPPPEPPLPPDVIATTVGPTGGTINVAGGAVSLSFASGALLVPTTVRVETSLAQNGEGDLTRVGTVAGVTLLPAPSDALPAPVELAFAAPGVPTNELRVARLMPTTGELREGTAPEGLWLPLSQSYVRDDGRIAVKTARFSRYAAVRGRASRCVPPDAMLAPPAAPAGYRYVGAEVAVNHIYDVARSTVPLSRAHSPRDLVFVRSRSGLASGVASGAVVCDFIVVHRFAPIAPADPECAAPADLLTPPPTPAGYRYVGYDVVTNFVLTTSTVPLTRAVRPTDTTVVRARSEVRDGVTVCDLIVAHTFELLPDGGAGDAGATDAGTADGGGTCVGASCAACVVPSAMRSPPAAPRGYRYVGTTVVINLMTVETTVPLDRAPRATDLSRVVARSIVQDFVTVCDIVVEHLYEPVAHTADGGAGGCSGATCETCVVPPALLSPPPTPNGYRYVGRTVVVNLQTVETTVPTSRRDKPSDHTAIRSHTIVRDGVTVCDIVVGHTFEPIPVDGDGGAATPPVCAGAAAGSGCGAGKACDGAGTCQTCVVPAGWLSPPPTPDGYRYVGYVVVINFVTTDITIPLDKPTKETDLTFIRSSTLVKNFQTICDIIVAHEFEPISSAAMCVGRPDGAACDDGNACTRTDTCQSGLCVGGNPVGCADAGAIDAGTADGGGTCVGASCAACVVPSAMRSPPAAPRGYRYVGTTVVINLMTVETTVPLDRAPRATDLSRVVARSIVQDFVTVCDIVVEHLYEPVAHTADGGAGGCSGATCETCVVPPALLSPPPTPNGYRYVGRTVVVNLQTVETTVPTSRRDKPSDHTAIRSHTIVRDGVTVCDIVVGHTFEPIPVDGDGGAATPPVCAGAAAGSGCGAGKACDGAGTCQTCVVPAGWLSPPPTPDGYRYVGYIVVINFVTTDITIPLDKPTKETDLTFIRSSTLVKNFQTICDIIVAHEFEPISSAAMCVGRPDGAACDDGNACTRTDTCQSGLCVGANPIVCSARGQCHAAGTCEPTTGSCSHPPKAAESPCDDNNTCTQVDVCRKGVCVGTQPQIGLNACYTAHPFLWAANRADNTVSKINTETGAIVARYLTSPGGGEPSRTAVSQSGSAWIGHHNAPLGESATSVTKIGLAEAGECQDRNGNGVIDTSTGPGDVKGWTGAWGGGVAGAEDECVLLHVPLEHPSATTPTDVRVLAVDRDNNLYAGGLTSPAIFKLSGVDGTVVAARDTAQPHATGTLDATLTLWTADPEAPVLQRIELLNLTSTSIPIPHRADTVCAGPLVLVMAVLATQLMATQIGLGIRMTDIRVGGSGMMPERSYGCAEGGLASDRKFYVQRRTAEFDQYLEYPVGPHGDVDTGNPRVFTLGPAGTEEPPENPGLGLDQSGNLWSAGESALFRLNPQSGVVVNFPIGFTAGPITNESTGFSARQVAGGCVGLPDGAPCNEGDACTGMDTCQSGVCVAGTALVCAASDQCHQAGTCAPATGRCGEEVAKPGGSPCDDDDLCTQTDTCQSGTCVGGSPVVCAAQDNCHVAGECAPATGACSHPAKADDSACDDNNACSAQDTCQGGVCVGQSLPVLTTCGASQSCCEGGCNCDDTVYTGMGPNAGTVVNGVVTEAGVSSPANPTVVTPIVWLTGDQGGQAAIVRIDAGTAAPLGPPTLLPGNPAKPCGGAAALDGSYWIGHKHPTEDAGAVTQIFADGSSGCRLRTGLSGNLPFVRALAVDRSGALWAAVWNDNRVLRIEASTCRVTHSIALSDGTGSAQPSQLVVDRTGQLTVTSNTGVFRVTTNAPFQAVRLSQMPSAALTVIRDSGFVIGSNGSGTLRRYGLPTLAQSDVLWPRAQQQPSLASHVIRALTADTAGNIYSLLAPPSAGPVFVAKYNLAGQYQGSVRLNQMSAASAIAVDAGQGLWVAGTLAQGQGQYGFAKRTSLIEADTQAGNPGDDQWLFVNPLPNIGLNANGSELTGLVLRTGTLDNGQLTRWTLPLDGPREPPDYLAWTVSGPAVAFSVTVMPAQPDPTLQVLGVGPFTEPPVDLGSVFAPDPIHLVVQLTTEGSLSQASVTLRRSRAR